MSAVLKPRHPEVQIHPEAKIAAARQRYPVSRMGGSAAVLSDDLSHLRLGRPHPQRVTSSRVGRPRLHVRSAPSSRSRFVRSRLPFAGPLAVPPILFAACDDDAGAASASRLRE